MALSTGAISLVTFTLLLTLSSAKLGTNCSEWNDVYGKQYWADEAAPCRVNRAGNITDIEGSGTEYCCRLYARLNAAFMFFITPKPEGLGCGATDQTQVTIFSKLYSMNCKEFAQKAPVPCPICNNTATNGTAGGNATTDANGTTAVVSPTPSVEPENLINPVPIGPNATSDGNATATEDDAGTANNTTPSGGVVDTTTTEQPGVEAPTSIGEGSSASANAGDKKNGSVCLHGSMRVQLENGRSVRVDALKVGDEVVGSGEIYLFSHNSREHAEFVNLTMGSGKWIAVTPGHLVHMEKSLMAADEIEVGMRLESGEVVRGKRRFWDDGIYNPHTLRGDIVVNGVRVSTYTAAIPRLGAHGALAVFRMVWRALRIHSNVLRCGVPSTGTLAGAPCTV